MAIVVVCNAIKVGSMIASLWALDDAPLVIIGDALSSFLDKPDDFTKGKCLMEARSFQVRDGTSETWVPTQHRWFYAPTRFSIIRCFVWYVANHPLLCVANILSSKLSCFTHTSCLAARYGPLNLEFRIYSFIL